MFRTIKQYFNKKNLKDKKYEFLFDETSNDEYVCFDCETTGLDPKKDDIVSIGAVIIKNNTIISSKKFVKFVKPKTKLQADAIKIGGPDNNSFGVICRMTDDLNFYAFIISSDGYSGILKVFEGKYELLNGDSMEFSSAIIKGDSLNQITAECFSNDLSLAVNGKNVLKAQDSDFTSGDVGFIVGTFDEAGVEVLFDNLSVIQP